MTISYRFKALGLPDHLSAVTTSARHLSEADEPYAALSRHHQASTTFQGDVLRFCATRRERLLSSWIIAVLMLFSAILPWFTMDGFWPSLV
ncbi:hypothetical protein NBM05_07450 [Rothia sp. AR01]|uniref:Uncharacterized protein n=1 Tax=Rothia santali TaxID=2949643 RepID=A0A9X2KL88_9MICC|nr:hypothetical protein [Rothia santali]MCP3425846.1 hypothetical protein [Rothia santali]